MPTTHFFKMAKGKLKIEGNTVSGTHEDFMEVFNEALKPKEKPIEIRAAHIKDDFCNYTYELKTGITIGDDCNRKGASPIHDDLRNKFSVLNIHLAALDDYFKVAQQEIADIDQLHGEELIVNYHVQGFRLSGSGHDEAVELIGKKHLEFGSIGIVSPKVEFTGSYPQANELKVAIDDCVNEVELYMNGKTAPKLIQAEMEFPGGEEITD